MLPTSRDVRVVGPQRAILGECPLWWPERSALFWVDIRGRLLHAVGWRGRQHRTWGLPELTAGLCLTSDDRLIVAMESRIELFDPRSGCFCGNWPMPDWHPGMRFNEIKCDPSGRVWVGSMNDRTRAPEGRLMTLTRNGLESVLLGVAVPNSLAWSIDGRTMYFADGQDPVIWRYDTVPRTGQLGDREPFHVLPDGVVPDGATVDSENFLWSAGYGAGRVTRYAPDGSIDAVVQMPVSQPTSCTFGGRCMDVLYITSASQRLSPGQLAQQPLAGATFAVDVTVRGLEPPRADVAHLGARGTISTSELAQDSIQSNCQHPLPPSGRSQW